MSDPDCFEDCEPGEHCACYAETGRYYGPEDPPDMDDFMPEWPEGTVLGWQFYETTSEGSPVSPVFATAEELAAWCEDGATVFASHRWTREQWLQSFRDDTTDVESLLYSDASGQHVGNPVKGA